MKQYTVAFIFTEDLSEMLFLHPKRPDWQVGFVSGPGGKVEEGESPDECMIREIQEETGLDISTEAWSMVLREDNAKESDAQVYFFSTVYKGSKDDVRQMTDEELEWMSTDPIPKNVLENLREFIPRAIEMERNRELEAERKPGERTIPSEIKIR